jgi:hypothetical protein
LPVSARAHNDFSNQCRVQKDLKLLCGPVSSTNKLILLSKLLEEVSEKAGLASESPFSRRISITSSTTFPSMSSSLFMEKVPSRMFDLSA